MLIDLILTDRRHYTYEGYMAKQVKHFFEEGHVPHRINYLADGGLQDYFSLIQTDRPDWTIGFTALTPQQMPLCDIVQIPHFYWIEAARALPLHFLRSKFGTVGMGDRNLCEKLNHPQVQHMPHGVTYRTPSAEKTFDLVLFADLIDLEYIRRTWMEILSPTQIESVERAIVCKDPLQAGQQFVYAYKYLQAEIVHRLIEEIGSSLRLDIFGEHAGNNWLIRLPPNIHLHASLPYTEYFEVLSMSKMAFLSNSDPWYLPAIAAGTLPIQRAEEGLEYVNHSVAREKKLSQLRPQLAERTWSLQIKKLMEKMS